MENHTVKFNNDEDGMKALAAFLAEIIRQGLTYNITNLSNSIDVTLIGGY